MKFKKNLLSSLALAVLFAASAQAASAATGEDAGGGPVQKSPIVTNMAGDYLAGQYAKNNGNLDLAIRSLKRVYAEDSDNIGVAIQLQSLMLMQGRLNEVEKLAEAIHASGAKDALSSLVISLRDIRDGRYDDASKVLTTAQDNGGMQLWMPLIAAWVDLGRNALDKPLQMDNITSNAGRAAPLVNYHLALLNNMAGFKEEAAKNFKDAVEDPRDPPRRVMKQLLKFYERNGSPDVLAPLVRSYREANPGPDQDSSLPDITGVRDGVAEVLYTMGGIMYGAGVANDAAIYLQLAVYMRPDLSEAVVALGDAYGDLQQYARANEIYGRISPKDPYYQNAQIHIAVNYERMGKLNESLALLDKMIKDASRNTEALITKADLLRIHGRYAEAVDAYTRALKSFRDPKTDSWPILFARGTCYEREGKWTEAEKDMLQALELKPDQPDVLNYLGFGWLERGVNSPEAFAMIKKAIKARPDDAQIVDSMGWALYKQGDYRGSMEYLERAVELLPGDPTVNDHLGDVYWRLGRKNEARFQWERSLSFTPEEKLSQSIQRKLREGLPATAMVTTMTTSDAADKPVAHAIP